MSEVIITKSVDVDVEISLKDVFGDWDIEEIASNIVDAIDSWEGVVALVIAIDEKAETVDEVTEPLIAHFKEVEASLKEAEEGSDPTGPEEESTSKQASELMKRLALAADKPLIVATGEMAKPVLETKAQPSRKRPIEDGDLTGQKWFFNRSIDLGDWLPCITTSPNEGQDNPATNGEGLVCAFNPDNVPDGKNLDVMLAAPKLLEALSDIAEGPCTKVINGQSCLEREEAELWCPACHALNVINNISR